MSKIAVAALVVLSSLLVTRAVDAADLDDAKAFLERPELSFLKTKPIAADGENAFKVDLGTPTASLWVVKQTAWSAVLLVNDPAGFRLSSIVPESATGTATTQTLFAVFGAAPGTLKAASLPSALQSAAGRYENGSVAFAAGANLYAQFASGDEGALGQLKKGGLLPNDPVWLTGTIGQGLSDKLFGGGSGSSATDFELTLKTGPLTPAPFASLSTPKLTLGASTYRFVKKGSDLAISGEQKGSTFVVGTHKFPIASTKITFKPDGMSGDFTITVEGRSDAKTRVDNAFSIPGFDIVTVSVTGTVSKSAQGAGFGLDLGARVVIDKKNFDGTFSVRVEAGKVTDLSLALGGELGLGFTKLPNAKDFVFKKLAVGINPSSGQGYLGGSLTWRDVSGDAVLVMKGQPTLFLHVADLDVGELVKSTDLPLPKLDAVLILGMAAKARQGIADLPLPVRAMITIATGSDVGTIDIVNGLSLLTKVESKAIGADVLGVEQTLVLGGSIDVLKPAFRLTAKLSSIPPIKGLPAGFAVEAPEVLVALAQKETGPVFEFGLACTIRFRLGDDNLVMQGTISVSTAGAFSFSGAMLSDWREPLDMADVVIVASPQKPLKVAIAVNADLSVDLGFQGAAKIGKLNYGPVALCINIQPAVPPVPKKFAFAFKGDEFGPKAQVGMMQTLVKSAVNGPLKNGIDDPKIRAALKIAASESDRFAASVNALPISQFKFTDVDAYLATPAVSCDIPAITGMGVKLAGKAYFMNKRLGEMESWVNVTDGLKIYADVAPFKFIDVIELREAKLDVLVPMPSIPPSIDDAGHFYLKGDTTVLAYTGRIDMSLDAFGASFEFDAALADLGSVRMEAKTTGANLAKAKDFRVGLTIPDAEKAFLRNLGAALKLSAAAHKVTTEAGKASAKEDRADAKADYDKLNAGIGKKSRDAEKAVSSAHKALKKAKRDLEKAKADCKKKMGAADFLCETVEAAQSAVELAASRKKDAKATLKAIQKTADYANLVTARTRVRAIDLEQTYFDSIMEGWGQLDAAGNSLMSGVKDSVLTLEEISLDGSVATATGSLTATVLVGREEIEEEWELDLKKPGALDLVPLVERIANEYREQSADEGSDLRKARKK